jgi:hypothetical protein
MYPKSGVNQKRYIDGSHIFPNTIKRVSSPGAAYID